VFDRDVAAALARDGADHVRRLLARDPALWSGDQAERRGISERLGWLDLPSSMAPRTGDLAAFADEVRAAGFTRVVLLGMGGSSLAPETFAGVFAPRPGYPSLTVLDSTDPACIAAVETAAPLASTFFLVSSKSGTTLETSDLFEYFWERTGGHGPQFGAVTDPGTPLATLAHERGLRRLFENPPDIGGRYSALSFFGLVPAALLGVDVPALLAHAREMAGRCGSAGKLEANPGAWLGATLAVAWRAGRDKVTLVAAPELAAFGPWAEQLLAESTGKEGKGLIPVAGEPLGRPSVYRADRLFVSLELEGSADASRLGTLDALAAAGHPVARLRVRDRLQLGMLFHWWEVATALAGAWMGINPFDQPNVAESKANTDRVLKQLVAGESPAAPPVAEPGQAAGALAAWAAGIRPGDYVAVLAYLQPTAEHDAALESMRVAVRDALGVATTAAYGPRYLHSTGQLHKGGPPTGAFLAVEGDGGPKLPVPGTDYTFGTLEHAQALGDLIALERRGRRLVRLRIDRGGMPELAAALVAACGARR
jgi:transaldolase/glucose-6-phosphate isomerase